MASDPTRPADAMREAELPPAGPRSQSVQRLQIGLSGLAAMILLVGLANIIMDRAKESEEQAVPEAAPTTVPTVTPEPRSDPLADVGVVPDLPAAPSPTATGQARPSADAPPSAQTQP